MLGAMKNQPLERRILRALPAARHTKETLTTALVAHGVEPGRAARIARDVIDYDSHDEARIMRSRNSKEAGSQAESAWLAKRAWIRAILAGNIRAIKLLLGCQGHVDTWECSTEFLQ